MALGSLLAISMAMLAPIAVPQGNLMQAIDLRCEFQVEPLGVDADHPRLSWAFQAPSKSKNQVQTAYRILVASTPEMLKTNKPDLWDSGTIASSHQNNIPYRGKKLPGGSAYFWKVATTDANGKTIWSRTSRWEQGVGIWTADWIQDQETKRVSDQELYNEHPAPLFRKEFGLEHKKVVSARLYITGLGYYEASINGKRVGDHVLDPGWTRFERRIGYSTYDVTHQLQAGKNCLGVILGNGWYNPLPLKLFGSFNLRDHLAIGQPCLLAQLRIEYADGSFETIQSDESWRVGDSHILRNDIYLGEIVDARKEQIGWNRIGFNDSNWRKPSIAKDPGGNYLGQHQPPIRISETWTATKLTEPKPGVFIYDMGENFAGWASFKLNLQSGTKLIMRYGELLHKDGTLNPMTSVAGQIKRSGVGGPGAPEIAWQTDTYIARGGGETYTPRFTFHGFRYVEVVGLDKPLPLKNITAMRLNSDVETVGSFECSNPLLNDIQQMCLRTFKSNIFSVQSDCPHRERLGYGGDIVATSEAFMSNYDMAGFYSKAVKDWSDSALADGMFTDTAPYMGIQYCGVIWAMAHPLLVDQLHQYYGDQQISKEEYRAAKRWLTEVEKKYPTGIVTDGLSDHEGLAPAPSPELVTPMYWQSVNLVANMAVRCGNSEDATRWRQLADKVQREYLRLYFDPVSGKVGPGTQTSQSMALYTGIIPIESKQQALNYLLEDIRKNGGKLTTGILGTKFMLDVLSREGHTDVAYNIVTQPEFPGWNWMLKNGATTLWEHWEFSDNTFSHNHPMFGSVSQWMIQHLGGIAPAKEAVGFDKIEIRPTVPKGLTWVKSSYKSIRGKIVSNWSRQGETVQFEIVIPPNCRAKVTLPKTEPIEIGSGSYSFSVKGI